MDWLWRGVMATWDCARHPVECWPRFKKAVLDAWARVKEAFQHGWLFSREVGAVAFATRVPTMVVALVLILLSCTEPAQDMLSEAALDVFEASPTTTPLFQVSRFATMLITLVLLAATAWYWSRVTLMYHRIMPDLVNNDEGRYQAKRRPGIVLWWPRLVGTSVFAGCAIGLIGACYQFWRLRAQGQSIELAIAAIAVFGLGAAFLSYLIFRRKTIAESKEDWKLAGAPDDRAPFERLIEIFTDATGKGQALGIKRVGKVFILISFFGTLTLLIIAGNAPVWLGQLLGGLAMALLGAAIAIPLFAMLAIASATNRLPLLGLIALVVILLPTINGLLAQRIDNHDVRTFAGKALPERLTLDQAFDAWFKEHYDATTIHYSSLCQARINHHLGECNSEVELKKCRDMGAERCPIWNERPPLIVIAAEGGASRAGYWMALSVGEMLRQNPKMRESIFAISSVSGGSLGAVLIRALIDLDRLQEKTLKLAPEQRVTCDSGETSPKPAPYLSCARVFMRRDFLAAAFAGMFYTDLAQRFIPSGLEPLPDRAETIELSWEQSWNDVINRLQNVPPEFKKKARGLFGRGFVGTWGKVSTTLGEPDVIRPWPILLLNGTNVETGRRVVTSNVKAVANTGSSTNSPLPCVAALTAYGQDSKVTNIGARLKECSVWEAPAVDDPFTTLEADIPISTAVNMSARFPIVQPAGGISTPKGDRAYHVVDGGIYENFGAQTVNDLLRHLLMVRVQAEISSGDKRDWGKFAAIRPMVVLVSTDHDLDGVRQVSAAFHGDDDRAGGSMRGARNPPYERKMRLGCSEDKADESVPLCKPKMMTTANEVLGDAFALYRTRSGRGESGILSIRETLANTHFYDDNFFHFRQCMNGTLRPASMTWYVSGISRKFMSYLLPSVLYAKSEYDFSTGDIGAAMAYISANPRLSPPQKLDPCQNHVELKRFLDRYARIKEGLR